MSDFGKIKFQVAGTLSRVYEFADSGQNRLGATVDYLGGSVSVSLVRSDYLKLSSLPSGSPVRVFGLVLVQKNGGLRLSASVVQSERDADWTPTTLEEEVSGVMFTGTCVVRQPSRTYKDRSGADVTCLDCRFSGGEITFIHVSPSLVAGLSAAQLLEVSGFAEPVTYFKEDKKQESGVRLQLVELKRLKMK